MENVNQRHKQLKKHYIKVLPPREEKKAKKSSINPTVLKLREENAKLKKENEILLRQSSRNSISVENLIPVDRPELKVSASKNGMLTSRVEGLFEAVKSVRFKVQKLGDTIANKIVNDVAPKSSEPPIHDGSIKDILNACASEVDLTTESLHNLQSFVDEIL